MPPRVQPAPKQKRRATRMDLFFRTMSRLGMHRAYVRAHVLPEWWDDRAGGTEPGLVQAVTYGARHIGVEPEHLLRMMRLASTQD